jgi:hypothetical protein
MLTLSGRDPFDRLMMSFGLREVPPNVMNCVEFSFDRSKGFGSARGQVWPIAIDRPTRPYNILLALYRAASDTVFVQHRSNKNRLTYK